MLGFGSSLAARAGSDLIGAAGALATAASVLTLTAAFLPAFATLAAARAQIDRW